MSGDLTEFRRDFLRETAVWASADSNFRHSAFVEVASRYLEDAGEVADFEPAYYRGFGARRKPLAVDGYAFDEADGSARLFIADPSFSDELTTLTQTDGRTLFGRLRAFVEECMTGRLQNELDESTPVHALAVELGRRAANLTRVRAYVLTDAVLSSRAKDWPDGDIAGVPVEFHLWDISRFHRVHTSRTGRDELIVDFSSVSSGGLPCLEAGTESEEYSAYLAVVPGSVLAEIYDTYGSRLLEGNVRSFLSTKGRINKGIRNTVQHHPEMFFAYNNGIAATASKVTLSRDGQELRLVTAADLQIVNGGQTTASLAAARRSNLSLERIFVPVKLSVVSPEISGEMIPLISRFANSQNKVSDADFFSNHEFHRRLEQISRQIWAPAKPGAQHETRWFYERARGQYINETASLTDAEKRRFLEMNPREQVITKTDLAKGENAWRKLPHVVSRGAQKNFLEFAAYTAEKWQSNPDSFHEDYYRCAVAKAILFRKTEQIVSSQLWYSGGYRANVVAFSIAKLAQIIEDEAENRSLDLLEIWQRQGLTAALIEQIELIAERMHEVITDPPAGIQNVTEWSKKELCWERAKQTRVTLLPAFVDELSEIEGLRSRERFSRARQRQDVGISAQANVIKLGRAYWLMLRSWAQQKRLLSPTDDRLVRIAAGLVQGLPTDKQSVRLLELKERLEAEGLQATKIPA